MPSPIVTTSLSVGFDTLRANPLRTILSTLGIVIGVAALVSVLSVGDGMERLARDQISTTTDLQRIAVQPRTFRLVDGTPFPVEHPISFDATDAGALRTLLGDSATVNLMTSGSALVTFPGDTTPRPTQVTGMMLPQAPLTDSSLAAGRPFTPAEGESGAPVVVVSARLAKELANGKPTSSILGDTIYFQGKPRRIIGVFAASLDERARRAMMPTGAVAGAVVTGPFDRPAMIAVTASTIEGVTRDRASIERWAEGRYGRGWKDRLSIVTDEARLDQVTRALLLFKVFMGALMSISLIVGGIGIMNVLLSSVVERTREIGIRKATGAAQRHILWQFLAESVAITGVGSVIGLVLGVTAAFAITAIMRQMVHAQVQAWLSVSTVLVAIGASVLVGLTFGLYPALRAARLSPIDAIHHE
ncbi:MAG TPA: ABC transporter permease [Gemmatimonadaceae bacterium]|nr:ABC transporter permease [Gemmatimonadaceae bacterium]